VAGPGIGNLRSLGLGSKLPVSNPATPEPSKDLSVKVFLVPIGCCRLPTTGLERCSALPPGVYSVFVPRKLHKVALIAEDSIHLQDRLGKGRSKPTFTED
jgi:hypothetical protein